MKRIHGELFRFLVVGVGSNLINFIIYIAAHAVGMPLMLASGTGYLAGLINSYYFGRNWVFNAKSVIGRTEMFRFVIVYAIGGVGMVFIIETLQRTLGIDYRICWFCGNIFAVANNFSGSKWLVFKGKNHEDK